MTNADTMDTLPDFFSPDVLLRHVSHTLSFYFPRCVDPSGGFFHCLRDDGTVYDRRTRHLLSSAGFVCALARGWRQFRDPDHQALVRHGIGFLRRVHRDPDSGGYRWLLEWDGASAQVLDGDERCEGLSSVLLAYAHALDAGVEEARAWVHETFELMEERLWEPEHGLYACHGQDANLRACEALLAAFHATNHLTYLHRAELVARNVCQRKAAEARACQPGHLTAWSKLLLKLESQGVHLNGPRDWLLPTAQDLYARAMRHGWDVRHGGLHAGVAEDGRVCDADKVYWVQAETLAASALLGARTRAARYWIDYERLWRYCWEHFVDHAHGGWYRILTHDNRSCSDEKSPPGKVDGATMGACYDIIPALAQRRSSVSK